MTIRLNEMQRETFEALVADLREDEVCDNYSLWAVLSDPGAVCFYDGTGRRWVLRSDGSFTWTT